MKPTLTLPALLVAGVIHLHAQEPTANEAAWDALVAAQKEQATTSPEALVIRDQILASPSISMKEVNVIYSVELANGGEAVRRETFRKLASSNKTGPGIANARATSKFWDGETSGWTNEMLELRPELASALAIRQPESPESLAFKQQVWSVIQTRGAHIGACRDLFKSHRATLPKAKQIEATRKQKDLMLAIPTRGVSANAWLAEISADLIALQLDQ